MLERHLDSRVDKFGFLARLNLPEKPSTGDFESGKRAIADQIVTGHGLLEVANALRPKYEKMTRTH